MFVYWSHEHVLYRRRTAIAHSTLCTVHTMRNTHTHSRSHRMKFTVGNAWSVACSAIVEGIVADLEGILLVAGSPSVSRMEKPRVTQMRRLHARRRHNAHMHAASGRSQTVWLTMTI